MSSLAKETGPIQLCIVLESVGARGDSGGGSAGRLEDLHVNNDRLYNIWLQWSMLMGCLVRQLSPHRQGGPPECLFRGLKPLLVLMLRDIQTQEQELKTTCFW